MKALAALCTLIILAPSGVAGQNGTPEQDVRAFLAAYEEARAKRDIPFLERALPEDYGYTGPNARFANREMTLRHFKLERDNPTYRRISPEWCGNRAE